MTFDGKTAKIERFEDLFHTMIKIEPAVTEQLNKITFTHYSERGLYKHFPI